MSRRGGTRNAPNPTHGELHRLHEQARLSRARADLARAQAEESALREGLGTFGMPGWADLFDPYSYRRDDFGTSALPYGAGTLAARQGGKNRPFAWTDFDLDLNRSLARHLVTGNSMAKGYVRAIRNFIVKKGYEYEARPAAAYKRDPEAARLALRVQRVIDRYSDVNRLPQKERAACFNSLRDGDVAVRHFAQPDGTTLNRWLLPEQIRNGPGCPLHSCTMGVEFDPHDVETHLAYWATYDGTEYDRVPAEEVSFFKRNVDDCVVRGLGEFVSSGEVFDGVRKLLKNMVTAGAVQAAIAWIEQFADSTLSQVTSHMAGIKDQNRPQLQGPISGRDLHYRKYEPGSIPLVGKGKQYVPPPVPVGSSAHIQIVQAALRSVGTEWNMPEYMVSGDASNNNFASILVSGSPFVNGIEAEQDDYGHFFLRWRWVAIRNACEAGLLAPYTFGQVMEAIDVHFTAPLVAVAKDEEQANIDHMDITAGVLSLPTRAARRGLDWEQEQANSQKYPPTRVASKATDIDAQGDPVKPGAAEQGQPAAAANPVRENKDASGHEHAADGKFGTGGGAAKGGGGEKGGEAKTPKTAADHAKISDRRTEAAQHKREMAKYKVADWYRHYAAELPGLPADLRAGAEEVRQMAATDRFAAGRVAAMKLIGQAVQAGVPADQRVMLTVIAGAMYQGELASKEADRLMKSGIKHARKAREMAAGSGASPVRESAALREAKDARGDEEEGDEP